LETCPHCNIGRLHPQRLTYVQVYNGTLVHIPNVPARRCDVCGQVFFDSEKLRQFEVMIGQAGLPPNRHTAAADLADAEHQPPQQGASEDAARPRSK